MPDSTQFDKFDPKKKAILIAMEKTFGNVTQSCKMIDCHRTTPYVWCDDDPEFKAIFQSDIWLEFKLDMIESKLNKLAIEDNPTVLIFMAKTLGKKRGYVERNEIEDKTERKIQFYTLPDGTRMEWK